MTPNAHTLSRKQKRDAARRQRKREDAEREARRRRARRVKLLALTAAAAILVAAGAIALGAGGGSPPSKVTAAGLVSTQLAGVPQADMTLGNPNAAVTINEYGDLQCSACAAFATGTLPEVIDKLVRSGAAKLSFHNWTIIDQTDSVTAAKASYAAGRQGRAWQFIELFYHNQGAERSGYVTSAFLDKLARASGINVATFNADRVSAAAGARVARDASPVFRS